MTEDLRMEIEAQYELPTDQLPSTWPASSYFHFILGLEGIPLFDIHEWGQSRRGQQETDFGGKYEYLVDKSFTTISI